jgi:tetratricopeptide (TPR) repeat protein
MTTTGALLLGVATLLFGANAGASPPLATLLEARQDRASAERTVERLESLAKSSASSEIHAALLHARFHLANEYLNGAEQLEQNKKNVTHGLRYLSRRLRAHFRTFEDLSERVSTLPRPAVGVLYWTTLSFGRTIESLSPLKRYPAAKRFRKALERSVDLQGAYFFGGPHRSLAMYLARAPGILGGDDDAAREHAQRAIKQGPRFAENYVNYAKILSISDGDQATLRGALKKAMSLPDDAIRPAIAEQKEAKAAARSMLRGPIE